MARVAPDTLTRLSVGETRGLSFEGSPASVTLRFLSDGSSEEWAGPFGDLSSTMPHRSVPDLVTCEWECDGAPVSARIDLVSRRLCSLDEVRGYRPNEYANQGASDEEAFASRARAEESIEAALGRFLQPVLRECFVDRPGCRTTTLGMCLQGMRTAYDVRRVVEARFATSGGFAPVRLLRPGRPVFDVSGMPAGTAATVVVEAGMDVTNDSKGAVLALSGWQLTPSVGPENATSQSTEGGVLRYVVGGVDGAYTSLPSVNAFIDRNRVRDWLVG